MSSHAAASVGDAFADLFYALGAQDEIQEILEIMPNDVSYAEILGTMICDQSWFDPGEIQLGGVFQITAPLIEMRDNNDPRWSVVCTMIDAMPEEFEGEDTAPEDGVLSTSEIYDNILLNMRGIRHGTEERPSDGLVTESGYRIFPEIPVVKNHQALA